MGARHGGLQRRLRAGGDTGGAPATARAVRGEGGERSFGPPHRRRWGSSYRGRAAGQCPGCRGGGRPGPGGEAAPSTPLEAGAAGPFPPPSLLPPL